jgi:hypothetical protein
MLFQFQVMFFLIRENVSCEIVAKSLIIHCIDCDEFPFPAISNRRIPLASVSSYFRTHDHSLEYYFFCFLLTHEKIHWYGNTWTKKHIPQWFEIGQHWYKLNGSIAWGLKISHPYCVHVIYMNDLIWRG